MKKIAALLNITLLFVWSIGLLSCHQNDAHTNGKTEYYTKLASIISPNVREGENIRQ